MKLSEVLIQLKALSTPEHFEKMSHFGINDGKALGVKVPLLRQLARNIGKNHDLAVELWATEIHEARLLAGMIEIPSLITENQFDLWVSDFDSWDLCDSVCDVLMKTPFVLQKIDQYSSDDLEFVKRTAFTLMCKLAFHDKKARNDLFCHFYSLIEQQAWDDRNFVRKAVNWALRQIGKRNEYLRLEAIAVAGRIYEQNTKSSRWIANDAIRELTDNKVVLRVRSKQE
jgi:3-methyladenine DNA glycosylase AlkD